MRLLVACLSLGIAVLRAQICAPARILPSGNASGTIDNFSCYLADATAYNAYRLDLPTRGTLQVGLTPSAGNFILILRDSTGVQVASGTSINNAVEAGSYTILVDSAAPGQVGAYTIQTSFTAEPGMWCAAFPSIGPNQTVAGALGASGCNMPSGTPYEAYLLNTFGSGTLTVSAAASNFTPVLIVRTSDGRAAASGSPPISLSIDSNSQYEIVVSTADNIGAYQLTTSFQIATAETCGPMKTFTDSGSDQAWIDATSCSQALDSGDLAYFSYYSLTVSAAGIADLKASSAEFTPTLYLLDAAGNTLAVDWGGGGNNQSELRVQLPPGNYTAELFSDASSGGPYTFSYQVTPGNPQPCAVATVNPGSTPSGALSAASCRTSLGLADLYSVTLPSSGTLDLHLAASAFSGIVAIRDVKNNLLAMDEDVEGLGVSHISADLPAGAYVIAAAAGSGAGPYQLTTAFTAHALSPCAGPQALTIAAPYLSLLGTASCRGANGQPVDYYQITLPADSVLAASMTSTQVPGNLALMDSSGNLLRSDSNSYAPGDPFIVQFLPAGTYQLAARAASVTVGGYYLVYAQAAQGPRPPFCGSRGTLSPGGSVSGALGIASCQYPDGTFADIYQLTLAANATINLTNTSSAFDPSLVLLDAQGNVVDTDDNTADGPAARITHALPAGTYYVVAKPFGDYTSIGAYTLSVQ